VNILIMNNGYLVHSVSGGTNHLFGVARGCAEQHNVSFIVPEPAADLLPERVQKICYPSHFPKSILGIVGVYLSRIIKATRRARRQPADVVLTLSLLFDIVPAFVHKAVFKSFVGVFVFHVIPFRKGKTFWQKLQFTLSYLAQRIALLFYRRADVIFAGNSQVRQELLDLGLPEERITIQYPAVNIEGVRRAVPTVKYDVVFVGRMVARKGIYDIVDASRDLGLRVGFIGEGEERLSLEQYIADGKLEDQFDVLGHLSVTELYSLLAGSRCVAFPSYEEGYGIVIAEAILAGKPVISYELPHYREAFGEGPILVPVGNKEALRHAFQQFAEGKVDEVAIRERYESVRILSEVDATEQVMSYMTSCMLEAAR